MRYVTADAAGNLATAAFRPVEIAALAAATAMGYAPMPPEPGRTSYVLNGAMFRDAEAVGGAIAHRFATEVPLAVTAGFDYGGRRNNTVRLGVAGEF